MHVALNEEDYYKVIRSIAHAMKEIREWGKEFDPQDLVGDYQKHHREMMVGKRSIGECIKVRAMQIIHMLAE
jgi:hypothetical protein